MPDSSPLKCTSVTRPEKSDMSHPAAVQSTAPLPHGNLSHYRTRSHTTSHHHTHARAMHTKERQGAHTLVYDKMPIFFVTMLDRETVQSSVVIGCRCNRRIREGLKAGKNPRLITSTTLFNTDSNVMVTHAPLTVTFVSKVTTFVPTTTSR